MLMDVKALFWLLTGGVNYFSLVNWDLNEMNEVNDETVLLCSLLVICLLFQSFQYKMYSSVVNPVIL